MSVRPAAAARSRSLDFWKYMLVLGCANAVEGRGEDYVYIVLSAATGNGLRG